MLGKDFQQMWNILPTLLPNSKKNLPTEISKLIFNEVEVFQNEKICHYFNKHFATEGMNLANQIRPGKKNLSLFFQIKFPLLQFLSHRLQLKFIIR